MENMMSLIECRKLTRVYKKGSTTITPLSDLDMDVEEGTFIALMGPSGSGKTTLLNLIAGIDTPTSGSLVVDGIEILLPCLTLAHWRGENIGHLPALQPYPGSV
jgi:putative ABC transport system ATP-binding protein